MRDRRHFLSQGFTLVELMIAISIFTTIATVLYASLRGGIVSWRRIDSELTNANKIRYALDRMSEDFRNMVFLSNIPFEGSADRIKCISFIKSEGEKSACLGGISYAVSFDNEAVSRGAIIKTEEPLEELLSIKVDEEEVKEHRQPKQQELISGVSGLRFAYLSASKEGEEIRYEWVDEWEEQDATPVGIKIEFTITPEDSTRGTKVSKRIYIPTARLPEKNATVIEK